jgi:hypothetical protein
MKKLLFLLGLMLIGVTVFARNYESELIGRMKKIEIEKQEALNSGVTADMKNAAGYLYNEWDSELNKIYKLLMTKLSKNEQTKLRESQKAWIQKKEKEAKAAAAKMEGGTGAGYLYIITELDMTKEKAIELAKRYDKLNK